ncbi:hypothetical protein COY07_00765 [Candidatus Peregrinibacteria bacterium CG_4_10_14_0_2_um_filter_43_11]|nr:MAG: hypothetical protein COY07_00765 [Candidatus Peregrinibacteria bacterium CG_4_10_14_0_2_um_filter_43_11]
MRILFYTDTPHVGGAEKQMELLAKTARKAGHSVCLAYGVYSQLNNGRTALEKAYNELLSIRTIHKHDPRHYFALKRILKKGHFDLIHIHLWNPGSCRYAFFAASQVGVPIVTTEHDPFALHGWKQWVKKRCIKRTKQTIAISADNFRQLMDTFDIPQERLNLVHNGIELNRFLDKMNGAQLPIPPGDTVITCIAEMHPRKGHRFLLDAFSELQKTIPDLHLMLVGTGPLEDELKKKYGDQPNIHFLGWREDVPEILKASDLFVLPSLKEAFGLVVVEAMASGVPVIATRAGGVPELVEDGKSGLLVPPADSTALTSAIATLIHDPERRRIIQKAGLDRARLFTAEKMTAKTIKVYEKARFV